MRTFARRLAAADLRCGDFSVALAEARPGDVVYADPPYAPPDDQASFTAYGPSGFPWSDQVRLANAARELAGRGIPVDISNHDTEETRALYAGARLHALTAYRSVAANSSRRGVAAELVAVFQYQERKSSTAPLPVRRPDDDTPPSGCRPRPLTLGRRGLVSWRPLPDRPNTDMALTKAELTDTLVNRLGLNQREAKEMVEAFFDEISTCLTAGNEVKLSGFGQFVVRNKPKRPGRNPKTKAPATISARRVVAFRPSGLLRARVAAT